MRYNNEDDERDGIRRFITTDRLNYGRALHCRCGYGWDDCAADGPCGCGREVARCPGCGRLYSPDPAARLPLITPPRHQDGGQPAEGDAPHGQPGVKVETSHSASRVGIT